MGKKLLRISVALALVGIVVMAGVKVTLMPESERELAKAEPKGLALKVRNRFADSVDETLGGREAKLGMAYLAGMKDGLDKDTKEMLRAVGLSHLVVASGTHLAIIVEFFKKRFGKISRFAGMFYSLVAVFLFGELIGWTASITRAAIVAGLSLMGWYAGRKLEAWQVILIAMAMTLLINPLYIVDLGWLLSFASFAGILILEPILVEFFFGRARAGSSAAERRRRRPSALGEMMLASVAAMVMCAPILMFYFGSISVISVVANLLILPTIPLAMGLTCLVGGVGLLPQWFLFDWLRFVVVKITTLLLDYHLVVMEFFAEQTSFILQMPKDNPLVFLWYVPVVAMVGLYYIRQGRRRRRAQFMVYRDFERRLPFTAH